ncbi:hypothetical protein ACIGBL_27920 [Streptomyces sp. NPDC085614]|uniref:hypothetical protein n=1 Tax=Streptomyces sp. NPDC085614 TaxID=3365733 RepID=UPI0037D94974
MAMTLGALMALSTVIAVVWTLTESSPVPLADRFGDVERVVSTSLEALRACVGTDNLSPQDGNLTHQVLASFASVTGALAPAVVLGVVMIKLFALRPFVWRRRASISHAWAADFPGYSREHAASDDAIIAVRFYNYLDNLTVVDLRARAHLRYLERSPHDGSLVIYKKWLKVLDEKGEPADERSWLAVERGAPFTVWIPLEAPADALPFRHIQGKDLSDSVGVKLLVRLTARTVGLGTEVVDERWFDLDGDDFERGRFTPLHADPAVDVWDWRGWEGFDEVLADEGTPPAVVPGDGVTGGDGVPVPRDPSAAG